VIPIENLLLIASIVLIFSIIASKASIQLGIPALLIFLLIGMLVGSEGPGGIYFDDPWLTQLIGVTALAFILFDGGLATEWKVIKPVLSMGAALSSGGVLISAVVVGVIISSLLNFSLLEGLLIGSIMASTDAAAVFSILRSKAVKLKGNLEPLLELESGSNDPMAVFLTIGFTQLIANPDQPVISLVPMFFWQMLLGGLIGYLFGRGMSMFLNRFKLAYEGLYPVLTVSLVLFTYSATAYMGGNGFLAVYLMGVIMRRHDFLRRRSIMRFHDGLAWLMQITMFTTLGLLVFPSQLIPIAGAGLLVSAVLILVGRPVSVFLILMLHKISPREKTLVSWVGLRGAAPIILATFPLLAGIPHSDTIFHLIFFVVLTSVLLQGTTIPYVAKLLKVDTPTEPPFPTYPLELVQSANPDSELVEVVVNENSAVVGKAIVDLNLPQGALVVLVHKRGEFIVPSGATIFDPGDRMLVLADKQSLEEVEKILNKTLVKKERRRDAGL
jgi:potassium/hydrogen antiporter